MATQYHPQENDKISVKGLLHVTVTKIHEEDDKDKSCRFDVDGFRQDSEGNCKPLEDEMSTQEIEKLLKSRSGKIYRLSHGEWTYNDWTIVLSARNGILR